MTSSGVVRRMGSTSATTRTNSSSPRPGRRSGMGSRPINHLRTDHGDDRYRADDRRESEAAAALTFIAPATRTRAIRIASALVGLDGSFVLFRAWAAVADLRRRVLAIHARARAPRGSAKRPRSRVPHTARRHGACQIPRAVVLNALLGIRIRISYDTDQSFDDDRIRSAHHLLGAADRAAFSDGDPRFSMIAQTPAGALNVDESSGCGDCRGGLRQSARRVAIIAPCQSHLLLNPGTSRPSCSPERRVAVAFDAPLRPSSARHGRSGRSPRHPCSLRWPFS